MTIPLPEPTLYLEPKHYVYTADQMRAAILAERERIAAMADRMKPAGGRQWTEAQAACFSCLDELAYAIRKGE